MRAAEASQFSKNFDDDDALLKPQWLQRPSGAGIANQFRSADQFRGGRGGRKFADDRRPRRMGEGFSHKASSPTPSSDFPPLAPFYRSHSTGSLTPADIPSASSRLLSASKEEKTFSINRECDFPTLATAASVVDQPARMCKSKSATALPQVISPSSDLLLKAQHTTLAAVAGPGSSFAVASVPILPAATAADALPSAPAAKQTHKKKPSFSDKVSFSEVAATEKAAANKDKFHQTMANNRAEIQRLRSLVPSKPVHPSLPNRPNIRPLQAKVRPKMPAASATVLKAPEQSMPTSPATMRKATSAPVLPMSNFPRSPPNASPLSGISNLSSISRVSTSTFPPSTSSSGPSSPPRPALMMFSQSARTLPQAHASTAADSIPPRQHFPIPVSSSRFSFANGNALPHNGSGGTISPRRRDSSPAAAAAASPLTSPRRGSTPVIALAQQEFDAAANMGVYSSSAPLSPRMPSAMTVNGGSNVSSGKGGKKPLRNSGSASSPASASKSSTQGKQRRRSVKSSNSTAANGVRRRSLTPEEDNATAPEPVIVVADQAQSVVTGFAVGHFSCSSSSSSDNSGSSSDDDLHQEPEYDRVNEDEVMRIATGVTSIAATCIAGVHLQPHLPPDEDEDSASASASGAGGVGKLKEEFCPFSWEMRADGEEWSGWSEDAVRTFMKKELGYDASGVEGDGCSGEEDEQGLTDEEIRLAKLQMERANLQQLLEKKKQGLSESLKNWQPPTTSPGSPSAGSALAPSSSPSLTPTSSTSPPLLRHHPRPIASLSTPSGVTSSSSSSTTTTGRRGPLRSSSGPSSAQLHGRRHHNLHQQVADLVDSDSDESEGEEVHGLHGVVFG